MYLQLRGLCPDSNIDRFYVPRNKRQSGSVQVIGLKKTTIEYDKGDLMWSLAVESHNTSATSEAAFESYALGAHEWMIENDSLECSSQGEPYKTRLKLSGCWEGEFTCNDGQCIRDCSS